MLNLPVIAKEENRAGCENQSYHKTRSKPYDYFGQRISRAIIEQLCRIDKDERYTYFLKCAILRRYEGDGEIIYVEIPQIPKNLIVYRRPANRNQSLEKLYLNRKDLPHIPLLEGEESLRLLSLENNYITKIDHLISLNNLLFLNLYENKISEIENLSNIPKLRALMLGKNNIEKIKNLNVLHDLEVLDLHSNKIKLIENLSSLKKLRILNLAKNQITSFVELMNNRNLEELNLRKNLIVSIPNLNNNFDKLKKINLAKNMISKIEFLLEFKKLKNLQELYVEENPVTFLKDAYQRLIPLPIQIKNSQQQQQYLNESRSSSLASSTAFSQSISRKSTLKDGKVGPKIKLVDVAKLPGSVKKEKPEKQEKTEKSLKGGTVDTLENNLNEDERKKLLDKIKDEWDEEFKLITSSGYNGYSIKKKKDTKSNLCHVEIEREKQMNLFGNSVEVLTYNEFYLTITKMHIEYVNYDYFMQTSNLENLKKFINLRELSFSHNNINSFYQLLKLEEIKQLEYLTIKNNEICNSNLLKYFLVYRLQNIKFFNDQEIINKDIVSSKKYFEQFDFAISYSESKIEEKKKEEAQDTPAKDKEVQSSCNVREDVYKIKYLNYVKKNLFTVLDEMVDL